jgi:hypothetical protein
MALFGNKGVGELTDALRKLFSSIEYYDPDANRNPPIASAERLEELTGDVVVLGNKLMAKGKADLAARCVEEASTWHVARTQKQYFRGGNGTSFDEARIAAANAAQSAPEDPLWPARQKCWEEALETVRERTGFTP